MHQPMQVRTLPALQTAAPYDAAQIRRLTATMGPAAIAKQLGVARSTVYRLLEQTE
jgi:IS30 family transposase